MTPAVAMVPLLPVQCSADFLIENSQVSFDMAAGDTDL